MTSRSIQLPWSSNSKESDCNAGGQGSIPGLGRSSGERDSKPLQYSCLENPMDREAWWAAVCGVAESDTTEPLTQVAANGTISFFCMAEWYSVVCVYIIYICTHIFFYPSICWWTLRLLRKKFLYPCPSYMFNPHLPYCFPWSCSKQNKTPQPYEVGSNHMKHYVLMVKMWLWGSSLLVQWLRLQAPHAGGLGLIPDQGARSHMPQWRAHKLQRRTWVLQLRPGTAKKEKERECGSEDEPLSFIIFALEFIRFKGSGMSLKSLSVTCCEISWFGYRSLKWDSTFFLKLLTFRSSLSQSRQHTLTLTYTHIPDMKVPWNGAKSHYVWCALIDYFLTSCFHGTTDLAH